MEKLLNWRPQNDCKSGLRKWSSAPKYQMRSCNKPAMRYLIHEDGNLQNDFRVILCKSAAPILSLEQRRNLTSLVAFGIQMKNVVENLVQQRSLLDDH